MRRRGTAAALAALLLVTGCLVTGCDPARPTPAPAPSARSLSASPSAGTGSPVGDGDWPTYHRDNARTGLAPGFPALGTLRRAWTAALDGAVYGQPLLVGDTVYAATEHDSVYALAAGTGQVRWSVHLGEPMPGRQLPCGNIDPLGITSTMVYDPATGLVFALAEPVGAHSTLLGDDARTGGVKVGRAAEPPRGDPVALQQRSALTLLGDRVYIAYGGLAGDCADYVGSVVAIPTSGSGPGLAYAVPTPGEGGIWTPGGGTVHNGRLLYAVGNGEATSGTYDGSDSVIALDADLKPLDRVAPSTWADGNDRDLDLGSMTAVVVNGYVLIAGKRGIGFTLRTDHFGGIGGAGGPGPGGRALCGGAGGGGTPHAPGPARGPGGPGVP